ncbi:hypothetical protein CEXT_138201 [Caerostris extrusa]|uniref:Uncharacterized protein n=1 Tax=Caerostris extrusa TaxID=172846 RepID=A0AAV4QQ17_CAEEX|nr:hypothetical protein CEXT_138201 [Caerostris extrusa]
MPLTSPTLLTNFILVDFYEKEKRGPSWGINPSFIALQNKCDSEGKCNLASFTGWRIEENIEDESEVSELPSVIGSRPIIYLEGLTSGFKRGFYEKERGPSWGINPSFIALQNKCDSEGKCNLASFTGWRIEENIEDESEVSGLPSVIGSRPIIYLEGLTSGFKRDARAQQIGSFSNI